MSGEAAGGGLSSGEAEAMIEATLRGGSLGLVDAAYQGRFAEHEKLLVVVDQFEELFRFRSAQEKIGTGDEAAAFVKLLIEAAQQRELSIYVVLTMRSDFLGDCAQFQGLPEAINEGQYLIPRLTRDERRFAVTGALLFEETLKNQEAYLEPYDANIADTFTGLSQVYEEMGLPGARQTLQRPGACDPPGRG